MTPTVAAEATAAISPWTGRFVDERLEAEFRAQMWPEWSTRLRVVSLLGALVVVSFGYSDWAVLGFGPKLYACWSVRLSVLAGAIVFGRLTRGQPDVARLDAALFALMLLFALALAVAVLLVGRSVLLVTPSATLLVLSFFLFAPTRFDIQLAGSLLLSAGFLLAATLRLASPPAEMVNATLLVLIANGLGAYTALRTHTLQRQQFIGRRQLERRARFEELVARLSTQFITEPVDRVEKSIDTALGEIGEFTGVDRAFVFEFDAAARQLTCTHEWCRAGVGPAMRAIRNAPFDAFPWAIAELHAGRPIVANRLEDLGPEAAAESSVVLEYGVKSFYALPLVHGTQVLGAIGFHAVRAPLQWDAARIAALRMVGEMIIGAVIHKRATQQLLEQRRTLEASVAALERSNLDLQQFAYVASHDLQEPLRTISSFSGLLGARYIGKIDPRADEYIRFVTAAAARMHEMITHLLDYSRLDARARPFEACEAGGLVRRALDNLRASVQESQAVIRVGRLPFVRGDPIQLTQLFQNIVGNALKFAGGKPPEITIAADRHGDEWQFIVADQGIGVDPQHAERIFQIFSRLHPREQYPGTGIGLAVCRRIVERHGGRIWVEPNQPRGSRFHFTLPAAE